MADGRKYYCMCESNCKYETMTKEQILAAIAQAMETGVVGDPDTGYVTKVQEGNRREQVTFWVGTQAQYNALQKIATNCMYIITDDTTEEDLTKKFEELERGFDGIKQSTSSAMLIAANALTMARASDIASKVTLTRSEKPSGVTDAYVLTKMYQYVAGTNLVYFSIGVLINGTIAAGEKLVFTQTGFPKSNSAYLDICNTSDPKICAWYTGGGNQETKLEISSPHDSVKMNGSLFISGYYFSSGE